MSNHGDSANGKRRLFVFGIDGATFDLIKPWAAEGKLPTFERLLARGAHAPVRSTPNQRSASAWASLVTGKNPGKHGILEFWDRLSNSYEIQFTNGSWRDGKSLWELMNDTGRQTTVINVPMTYPARPLNGVLIAGIDSPGIDSDGFCYPPGVIKEILQRNGNYILEPGVATLALTGREGEVWDLVRECTVLRKKAADYLMDSCPWDFFMVIYRAADAVQHFFWKHIDPKHPRYCREEAEKYGDVILKLYQQLDELLADTLLQIDEDTTLVVVSDHGFGHNQGANAHLYNWLEDLGLMAFLDESHRGGFGNRLRSICLRSLAGVYRQIQRHTDRRMKERLWRLFPGLRNKVQSKLWYAEIDWSRTRVYSDIARESLWVNLRGREPRGIVEPGQESEEILKFVEDQLMACTDPLSGEKVVEQVHRKEELYHGPYVCRAPDLNIEWRPDVYIGGMVSPACRSRSDRDRSGGSVARKPAEKFLITSGQHRPHGIFLAYGKDIQPGCRQNELNIVDVAPTLLHLMGIPIPDDMDGIVATDIVSPTAELGPPQYVPASSFDSPGESSHYSEDESGVVEDRLRGLGYL
ncbi:MAG: alkaline phosphatase family protein [Armatimonadetes bacterium]|nr:alkaline phosphatase family protein [Armatimonadota bacterium]